MKQKIQVALILAMFVAGIRLAIILYERHEDAIEQTKKPEVRALNPDYYVTPKKLYPYDLKSAKQLTRQPAWVKVGYAYSYYAYDPATHRANFSHEAGKLLPIQKLEIRDIVIGISPNAPGERQVMAVFVQEGKQYAPAIGTEKNGDHPLLSDCILFVHNPAQPYKHLPAA